MVLAILAGIALIPIILKISTIIYIRANREKLRNSEKQKVASIENESDSLVNKYKKCLEVISDLELNQTIDCSSAVVANINRDPMSYLVKYSNVDYSHKSLDYMKGLLVFYNSYAEFYDKLQKLNIRLFNKIPVIFRPFIKLDKIEEVIYDFDDNLYEIDYPYLKFSYVSSAGRSKRNSEIELNEEQLEAIIENIKDRIGKEGHTKHQRSRMTKELREAIKKRDGYTCQICGNSIEEEPNLLLEVDHIVPVSKGGKTEPDNLQTLCWKCNREKGGK